MQRLELELELELEMELELELEPDAQRFLLQLAGEGGAKRRMRAGFRCPFRPSDFATTDG